MSSAAEPTLLAHHFESLDKQAHAVRLGMWLFLATEILLFAVLFCGYGVYRFLYPEAFELSSRAIGTGPGLINTIVLITSSLTVALGVDAARKGQFGKTRALFLLSFALGGLFLVFKFFEYRHHFHEGQLPGRYYTFQEIQAPGVTIFWSLYFIITGLHGVHVVIGMTVLLVIGLRAGAGAWTARYHVPVELGGLYWHLVDLIWIFVFPLIYLV